MGRLPYLTRIVGSPPSQGPIVKPAHPLMSRWQLATTAPEPAKRIVASDAIATAPEASLPVRPAAPVAVASHLGAGREKTPPPSPADPPGSPIPDQGVGPTRPPTRAHHVAPRSASPPVSPRDPIEPPPPRRGGDFDATSPSRERVRPAGMHPDQASAPRKHWQQQMDWPHMLDDAPARAREPRRPDITPMRQNVLFRDAPPTRETPSAGSGQAPAHRAPEFPKSPRPVMLEPRPPAVPPAPPAEPRPHQDGGVRIGSIEIHIEPPPARPQPAGRAAPPRPAAPLTREFTSPFGLRQG